MSGMQVLEFCFMAVAVSVTAVIVTGSLAFVIGMFAVFLGRDKDD